MLSVQKFSIKNSMTPIPHSPYSLHLAQSNFCWFPRMKKDFKGKCFANVEEVRQKTAEAAESIKIDEFKNWFEQWKKRLDRCIASDGEYFEGDWSLNM